MHRFFPFFLLFLAVPALAPAQSPVSLLRADSLGTHKALKQGFLSGNQITVLVRNNGFIGNSLVPDAFSWKPTGSHIYLNGMQMVAGGSFPSRVTGKQPFYSVETWVPYPELLDDPSAGPSWLSEETWGWNPVPYYLAPGKDLLLKSDPSTWPEVWPAALGSSAEPGKWPGCLYPFSLPSAEETFSVMDDSKDAEFTKYPHNFYPLISDTPATRTDPAHWYNPKIRKGLGLRAQNRILQWTSGGLKDALLIIRDVTNLSDYPIGDFTFGAWMELREEVTEKEGIATFRPDLTSVFWRDYDQTLPGNPGVKPATLALVFLELPSTLALAANQIDDDGDGLTDESRTDGVDNDGDWGPADDLGADGLPGTGDPGEGDGLPTAGEPDFDRTDPDEADQTRLGSLLSGYPYQTGFKPGTDDSFYNTLMTGSVFSEAATGEFNLLLAGTKPLAVQPGETVRLAQAVVFDADLTGLENKVRNLRQFYANGFRTDSLAAGVFPENTRPAGASLHPSFPNPFNPGTTVAFTLHQPGKIRLTIINPLGQLVRLVSDEVRPAGYQTIYTDFTGLPSGLYLAVLETGNRIYSRKLMLVR